MAADLENPDFYVVAAVAAADLSAALEVAEDVSLAAANANAIGHRAGEAARGFRPITDFMDEVARDTIRLVRDINQEALAISRVSIRKMRSDTAWLRFENVKKRVNNDTTSRSLETVLERVSLMIREEHQLVERHLRNLMALLDEVELRMRAVRSVAASARVEAIHTGDYRPHFESVAETMDNAAEIIRERVLRNRRMFEQVELR